MAVEVIRSKKRASGAPRKVWEFALEFYAGTKPVVHEFKAYPSMDAGGLNYTLTATHKPERAIEGMVRSIRKMLADDDGTPADYRPARYVEPEPDQRPDVEDPDMPEGWQDAALAGWQENPVAQAVEDREPEAADPEDEDAEDGDLLFVGPDGSPVDSEAVTAAMKFEAGSSRRRFSYLMDEDESLTLEVDQLQTVYKKLLAQVADRPTRR
jgi:hypothetical protein